MKRREFIALLGGAAAAWPLAARAQQRTVPVVGYLSGGSAGPFAPFLAAFRQGLRESGYVEGQNVAIEYRWAEGIYDQLPALAADLVGRKVDVIAAMLQAMQESARVKGVQIHVLKASTAGEIDTAFATLSSHLRAAALIVQSDPFFVGRRGQFALLAARYTIPTIYDLRPFVEAGGLINYGPSLPAVYHQVGAYAGRLLRGEKPVDLPVMQPTKFELVVNLMAAKAIELTIPESFLLRADEVIE